MIEELLCHEIFPLKFGIAINKHANNFFSKITIDHGAHYVVAII